MAAVTPIRLHYNTVYLVEDGGERVLIDTGPDYRGAWDELLGALAGRLPSLVVATHGHHDHAGMGRSWLDAGVPVAIGAADLPFTAQPGAHRENESAMLEQLIASVGAPAGNARDAAQGLARRRASVAAASSGYPPPGSRPHWPTGLRFRPYQPSLTLDGDTPLPAGLRALACPGHTPGNLVIFHEAEGWLFSGDQLLPDITPTPGLQLSGRESPARFRSLPPFLRSLERLQRLDATHCYPGHGGAFDSVAETLEQNIKVIEGRTARVHAELREVGPLTVYALAERLYPRALRRRFWQIIPTVIGHLDLLEEQGLAFDADGVWTAR